MAGLKVEGDTLGEKHKNYNKLVNEAIKNNLTEQITAINYEDSDTYNLFKIDIACHKRDVEYILEALKCEDMLYVSRVLKKSTWLTTNPQYSHIINPEYLHKILYPQMTSKAFNKLILHIRLNLKDEKRVDEFFNYYKKDTNKSFKWLPQCSVPVIEKAVEKHINRMPGNLLKQLYEKSFTILETAIRNYTYSYYKDVVIRHGKFLLKRDFDKFLGVIESLKRGESIEFGPKYTRMIMKKCPERVKNNLEKYVHFLDLPTFAKYLKKEEVKSFILTHIKNHNTRQWFTFKRIKYFLNLIPFEERFNFVNKHFIEKKCEDKNISEETWNDIVEYCNLPIKDKLSSSKNIWSWYVYAPFDTAFIDLTQLIRNESSPTERLWICRTLLDCAGSDQKNIFTLLKYYCEHHISEAFIYKVQFANHLISKTDTHKYDKESWRYLSYLFTSLEVFTTPKEVEMCVKSIVLRQVTHDEKVPIIVEGKFNFEYFIKYGYASWKHKFNPEEREKLFNYFYKYYTSKISIDITSEEELDENLEIIKIVLKLLEEWNKELKEYPFILQKINELIVKKKENSWTCDLSDVYNFKKSWRRLLFPESIIINPNQDTCINALKHDPELLENYRQEIYSAIYGKVPFDRFLKKIRHDWHQSIASSFKKTFKENLDQKNNIKTSVRGLCTLLSRKEFLDLIEQYGPKEPKIVLNKAEDLMINICKNIASCMHLARPQPPLDLVLLFAKGHYLHSALPSLNAILYNTSTTRLQGYIPSLLNAPVSLQKHAIRAAFAKLNHKELKTVFSEFWQSSKNKSVRKVIFCETYKKLCKERDEDDKTILELWELLSKYIDTLTYEENNEIYLSLSKAENIPLTIRAAFWMKSYEFLNKAPDNKDLIVNLDTSINDIIQFLNANFMKKIFFEHLDEKLYKNPNTNEKFNEQIVLYLLSTETELIQRERYEKVFVPIIEKVVTIWNNRDKNCCNALSNLRAIFDFMAKEFESLVLKKGMVFPIVMYSDMLTKLQSMLPIKEHYVFLTFIKLSLGFMETLYELKQEYFVPQEKFALVDSEELQNLYDRAGPVFGKWCLGFLKEEVANNWSTIYITFGCALKHLFDVYVKFDYTYKLNVLKGLLDSKDFVEGYLLVTAMLPEAGGYDSESRALLLEILEKISTNPSEIVTVHYWYARKNEINYLT